MLVEIANSSYIYIPLIGIGAIHWTIWGIRKYNSVKYKPYKAPYKASTSIVIPVYKEDPKILRRVLDKIFANNPTEVITVIDYTDVKNIKLSRSYKKIKTIVTKIPGKRPALGTGIKAAKSDIVVLVDSDTEWVSKNFLKELIKPFKDPKVGGVGSRQNVHNPDSSLMRKLINWTLDTKYLDFVPGMARHGVVTCLSGRTAAYKRKVAARVADEMVDEKFMGKQCVGGDDGRLTTLILREGYKTVYQPDARAETHFEKNPLLFLKQKVRWSRNSYRNHLNPFFHGWGWKKGWMFLLSSYHTIFPGIIYFFFLLLLIISAIAKNLFLFLFLSIWAMVGRQIKGISHLKERPKDFFLIPLIAFYYVIPLTIIKVYTFLTIRSQEWLGSRGDYQIDRRHQLVKEEAIKKKTARVI